MSDREELAAIARPKPGGCLVVDPVTTGVS
jgi:hypothetical protein